MAVTLEQWYRSMPVVTRSYLTLSFLTTAGCALELISRSAVRFGLAEVKISRDWLY